MSDTKKQYARLEPFKKREIRILTPYYYQGGQWFKVANIERNQKKKAGK